MSGTPSQQPEDPSRFVQCRYGPSQDGSILLYAGDLEMTKDGSSRHVQGDVRLHLGAPRPALRVHFAGADPWIADIAMGNRPSVVEVPVHAPLEPPRQSAVSTPPEGVASWAECDFWINQLRAGELGSAERLVLYIVGRLTDWPLPRVETIDGSQGQVLFSLPGWDLRLVAVDQLAPETKFSFVIEAVPQSLPIDNSEAQNLIRRVHLLMRFLGAGGVGVGPRTGLDAAGRIVWAEWGAPSYSRDRAGTRWCTDELVITALPALADGLARVAADPGLGRDQACCGV